MEKSTHLDDERILKRLLEPLDWLNWQYYPVVGSTNDIALEWTKTGAPDWGLVIADQQSAGRGRGDRRWVTNPGSALAISIVIQPSPQELQMLPRFTALAALGLVNALEILGLQAEIKWPNDVLLDGKKAAGVLVETEWRESDLTALVIGLGVNVLAESVPPVGQLRYPAISVAEASGSTVDRWELMVDLVKAMKNLRPSLTSDEFIRAWNKKLAFCGEVKRICLPGGTVEEFEILGVTPEGALEVRDRDGKRVEIVSGEIDMGLLT
ncbi:MAG TPA: biotin--[acetyl-CoA-carboxylase] ligase [Brevefilum sp.]